MAKFLILGGSGGIGAALARRLATNGHELVLAGRNEASLDAVAREIGARSLVLDVLDPDRLKRAAAAMDGPLDGLAYAVGTINLKPFARLSEEDFVNDFRVNALGAAQAIQAFLPHLAKAGKGAGILLFSTVAVEQGFGSHASIAMAKGAVAGLVRSLAAELAPAIRVNAIAPSLVETPLGRKVASNERMAEAIAKMHPLPRLGSPDDIAAMGEILLTEAGSWITGQIVGVDGGRSRLAATRAG